MGLGGIIRGHLKVAARGTYATQNDLILQHHLLFGACGKWVFSVRSRPFRVRAGTQKTPDGLTLNMQRKTDGLLTHSLAVQSNYFVVPINPALATILARDRPGWSHNVDLCA